MMTETINRSCPYCGEPITLIIDCSAGDQSYIEDCEVCCRPIEISVMTGPDGLEGVVLATDSE
jgi:hypothetical protein